MPQLLSKETIIHFYQNSTCLVGQLHLLSSTVTMLAVPSPSLTATLARGGNYPAVAVPLVALGTQNGTIDVIDVSANAVAASFSVHNSTVRGLRWLGNSRLVSFSYTQGSEKTGGYINRLIVTCVRSGLNRPFRVLQKPERAPIRALRASSSGSSNAAKLAEAPTMLERIKGTRISTPALLISMKRLNPSIHCPLCTNPDIKVVQENKFFFAILRKSSTASDFHPLRAYPEIIAVEETKFSVKPENFSGSTQRKFSSNQRISLDQSRENSL
ncbi:hypothetical protein TEA_026017 [Camellia sinensis var. sinensis]|uniref:WDR11 second beta-propeller domain-containing protein n=1 Tax=Camellia sinensis var. sinensis TaxID=542762 RepID=A0A4S4DQV1_CAMSN|nr:hypothetical protein TEA_026017 [Camellia sinensis var. sinensis]